MVQEIIAYIIIGTAVLVAIQKFNKKFSKKKKSSEAQKNTISPQNKCADCSADCLLKDSVNPIKGYDSNICKKKEMSKI